MQLSKLKRQMQRDGNLDDRGLLCYAMLTGTVSGNSYQNLVGAAFLPDVLQLYRANIDGSLSDPLIRIPYTEIQNFVLKHRLLYSFTEFDLIGDHLRFYNYDKKVFLRGFRDAGTLASREA